MIKLIIFDMWNTLIPINLDLKKIAKLTKHEHLSHGEIVAKYERAVQLKKYKSFEELKKDFFRAFKQENNIELEEMLVEIYINRVGEIKFFSDIKKNLVKLKKQGYKLALLSNAEGFNQKRIENILELRRYFDSITYSFEIHSLKPSKRMFRAALRKHKVKPHEALMVGDSLRSDVTGAKKAGLHAVWLNRPKRSFDFAKIKPEFEINTLNDIYLILSELNGSFKKTKN
jgi:2-haloalkanoic acid dehalogenase type II